jgi:hypothetical protein
MQSADLFQVYKRLAEKLRQQRSIPYYTAGLISLYAFQTASRSNKA